MNVIVTLAGHSRRFKEKGYKEPKFLIKIDTKTMIEHVLNMFNDNDNFFLIINKTQAKIPGLINKLKKLKKKISIKIIKNHDIGPVYTASILDCIDNKKECIITYCDLIVDWDYKKFLRDVYGYDAAISCFRGFQPASFGKTYFAYIKASKNNQFIKIKEKESFTKKRHQELASTGIYYFKSYDLFKKYAFKLLNDKNYDNSKILNNEKYVSLLFNLIKKDKLLIKITEVRKFICLGAPYFLKQYQFWQTYFTNSNKQIYNLFNQTNLIAMAGRSDRFKKYGYKTSKALINISGKPMFIKSALTYPQSKKWVFLPTKKDFENYNFKKIINKNNYFNNYEILPINKKTSGQAETCMMVQDQLDHNNPLLVGSCDYSIEYSIGSLLKLISNKNIDVLIWTYKLKNLIVKDPNAFAFCKTKKDNFTVTKIIEKKIISKNPEEDQFVVGNFWFRKSKYFFEAIKDSIDNNNKINGEFYIGNSLNYLIKKKFNICTFPIDKFISYGNPFELMIYEFWEEYFNDNH